MSPDNADIRFAIESLPTTVIEYDPDNLRPEAFDGLVVGVSTDGTSLISESKRVTLAAARAVRGARFDQRYVYAVTCGERTLFVADL